MMKKSAKNAVPAFKHGEKFVFTTFVNRARKAGYTVSEAKALFEEMKAAGKIHSAGSVGLLKNIKVYQIAG